MLIQVSTSEKCTNPTTVGISSILFTRWVEDHVRHFQANPLGCVLNSNVQNFKIKVRNLPEGYALGVHAESGNNSGTATVSDDIVTFTLPVNVGTDQWSIDVNDTTKPGPPKDSIWVQVTYAV